MQGASPLMQSSEQPGDMLPPEDALADALGQVLARTQHEWRKDAELHKAETRAVIAEFSAAYLTLKAELHEERQRYAAEIAELKAQIKDGAPGEPGKDGKDADITELREEVSGLVAEARTALKAEVDLVADVLAKVQDGAPGEPGCDGVDGKDGVDGQPGRDGIDGIAGEPGKDGVDGKDADAHEIAALLVPEVERAVTAQVSPEIIKTMVTEEVAALPKPEDGKSVTIDDVRPLLEEMVAAIPKPENGKDADPAEIAAHLLPEVERTIAAMPVPQDGKDADPAVVEALVEAAVEKRLSGLPVPKDGVDGKDAEIPEAPEDVAYQVDKALEILRQPAILFPSIPQQFERQQQPVVNVVPQPRPRLRSAVKGKGGEIHFQYEGE